MIKKLKILKFAFIVFALNFIIFNFLFAFESYPLRYIRLDLKSINGVVKDSKLLIIPVRDEFRAESFKRISINGITNAVAQNNLEELATKDALSTLLIKYGSKSVKGKSSPSKREIILSYEGIVRYPYIIANKNYNKKDASFIINLEVFFSPIAFKSEWKKLYKKNKFKKFFKELFN